MNLIVGEGRKIACVISGRYVQKFSLNVVGRGIWHFSFTLFGIPQATLIHHNVCLQIQFC